MGQQTFAKKPPRYAPDITLWKTPVTSTVQRYILAAFLILGKIHQWQGRILKTWQVAISQKQKCFLTSTNDREGFWGISKLYFIETKMFVYSLKSFKKVFWKLSSNTQKVPHVPNRYRIPRRFLSSYVAYRETIPLTLWHENQLSYDNSQPQVTIVGFNARGPPKKTLAL